MTNRGCDALDKFWGKGDDNTLCHIPTGDFSNYCFKGYASNVALLLFPC